MFTGELQYGHFSLADLIVNYRSPAVISNSAIAVIFESYLFKLYLIRFACKLVHICADEI